ncbi:hypothetical protein CFIMG_005717RA [Ceratocystis fimbriata CBS 114723]|uniref:Uncharacterized protein n=1 Tax=Ceratocystis fimbriata CBS 114723 TaxID=1035309 RepID=A0A2C5WI44_9PEZI|nr:hypothetical protein CFIMG_005717RA [Ceratocystis fimbriata CBS 114723]
MPSTAPVSSAEPFEEAPVTSTATSTPTPTSAPAANANSTSRKAPVVSRSTRAARGRARGGRSRGRGGRQNAASNRTNAGVGQGRKGRGRIKQFGDALVQACYERSREVKDHYNLLLAALRPALGDLAQRNIDKLMAEPHAHELTPEYQKVIEGVNARFAQTINEINVRFHAEQHALCQAMDHQRYVIQEQTKNAIEDAECQFIDAQMNRLRILEKLYDLGLPVDIEDLDHIFKPITDVEYKNFGPFVDYDEDEHVVPYPSRVPGTEMYKLLQQFTQQYKIEKAAATAAAQEARLQARALAQQEEAESSTKRRGDRTSTMASRRNPRSNARGGRQNATASNNTNNSAPPATAANGYEPAENDEDEPATAKHPMGILGGVGDEAVALESSTAVQEPEVEEEEEIADTTNSELPVRERSPPPPTGMQPPDEYGAAIVISRGKGHNRIMLRPPPFEVDDIEIGFRDSSNDPTRGANVAANRGKYTGTPHTGSVHVDPMLWNYDARANKEGDLDEKLVEKHQLHPSFGFFLRTSRNDDPVPEERPEDVHRGRPVVYLPPGDVIVSACRSTVAMISEKVDDARKGEEIGTAISVYCEAVGIEKEEIVPGSDELIPPEFRGQSLRYPSLRGDRTAMRRLFAEETARAARLAACVKNEQSVSVSDTSGDDARAHQEQPEQSGADMDTQGIESLVQASILASARDLAEDSSEQRSSYDAIRDVFRPSAPEPPRREIASIAMLTLAAACDTAPRIQEFGAYAPPSTGPLASLPLMHQNYASSDAPLPMNGYEMGISMANPDGYPGHNNGMHPQVRYEQPPPMGQQQLPLENYQQQDSVNQYAHMANSDYPQSQQMVAAQRSPLPPLRPAVQEHIAIRHEAEQPAVGGFYPPPPPGLASGSHHGYQYPVEHMGSQQQPSHQQQMPIGSVSASGNGFYQNQPSPASFSSPSLYESHLGQQQLAPASSRDRSSSVATLPPSSNLAPGSAASSAGKYRKLEPAPVPKHRLGWANDTQPQLRTVGYDPSSDIKDYAANEPLPGRAPTYIRAWSHNGANAPRRNSKKDGERRDAE